MLYPQCAFAPNPSPPYPFLFFVKLVMLHCHRLSNTPLFFFFLRKNRVVYRSSGPYYTEVSYGLFQKCSTLTDDCRRFPQKAYGDCDQDKESGRGMNMCTEWRIAAGAAVVASIVGLWIIAALTAVLYSGERWHASGWKHILGLVGVFGKSYSKKEE